MQKTMSRFKKRRWRRDHLNRRTDYPSWGKEFFGERIYGLRYLLLALFVCCFVTFAMLLQLESYGFWEAKGARVGGVVGHGIAYIFAAISMGLLLAIIKEWRGD
ncbi:hypothetical protein [Simiduia aestuariiviva]|uniref:Uncharacterized protein n=1 Tax=Simiduia aestuariiviva TaxID=1510459 RepID=A0A839UUU1_9GAMM|nr:hypothetical protein [Simiduia aestuariiviva]MBB3170199.1 hypothetical protein [Simiduia aestuariiviva]